MNDSSDDGLCDGDSNLKKYSNLNFKNAAPGVFWKDSKLVQKSSSVVVVIEGFRGWNQWNQWLRSISYWSQFLRSILEKQWESNGRIMVEQCFSGLKFRDMCREQNGEEWIKCALVI